MGYEVKYLKSPIYPATWFWRVGPVRPDAYGLPTSDGVQMVKALGLFCWEPESVEKEIRYNQAVDGDRWLGKQITLRRATSTSSPSRWV